MLQPFLSFDEVLLKETLPHVKEGRTVINM